jgi:transposase
MGVGIAKKIHALTDADGRPVKTVITPGQPHDIKAAAELLTGIRNGQMVLAD